MNKRQDLREIAMIVIAIVWGTIGVISTLKIVKGYFTSSVVEPGIYVLLVAAVVTVVAVLLNDMFRRAVGVAWLLVAFLGFLMLVVGSGLEIEWMQDMSLNTLACGLITAQFMLLPEIGSNK